MGKINEKIIRANTTSSTNLFDFIFENNILEHLNLLLECFSINKRLIIRFYSIQNIFFRKHIQCLLVHIFHILYFNYIHNRCCSTRDNMFFVLYIFFERASSLWMYYDHCCECRFDMDTSMMINIQNTE